MTGAGLDPAGNKEHAHAPDRSIDCHAHVIDQQRFAYVEGAGYRPWPHETGAREAFAATLDAFTATGISDPLRSSFR
jgi:hypothetical protein